MFELPPPRWYFCLLDLPNKEQPKKQGVHFSSLAHRIHGTGIFPYIYHKFEPNVGKYTSPMDPMGFAYSKTHRKKHTSVTSKQFSCTASIKKKSDLDIFRPNAAPSQDLTFFRWWKTTKTEKLFGICLVHQQQINQKPHFPTISGVFGAWLKLFLGIWCNSVKPRNNRQES